MAEFVMPILGADMEAGTLVTWRKRPGDSVTRGEIIAEVETEKGLIEVQIFTSGVIERLVVQPGQRVPVGTVLAIVRAEGREEGAAAPAGPGGRVRISPLARKRAAELGVDPASIQGTGPDGSVTREDVERVAAQAPRVEPAPPAPPSAISLDRLAQLRQTIGAAMARSKRETPHYYLGTTIDMHRATTWLVEENARRPVTERLLANVLLVKAVALALREVPELNSVWAGGKIVPSPAVHVGFAISLRQGGLVAPAVHDTDRQSLDELMRGLRDLVKRARAGSLRSSELSDPTITVTSLGEQGVETVFGIIYPPQVAIVGFGRIVERPWSVAGQIVSRPLVVATLSADHRVTDGHRGGLFLAALDRLLQEPARL